MSDDLGKLADTVLNRAKQAGLTIVTAESCTAGLMCQVLSDAEGASVQFHGGFVTYTKEHKVRALGVSESLLRTQGAVCAAVAREMATGALEHSSADVSASITGVAGPEPDEDGNPVGRVCIGVARRGSPPRAFEHHYGDIGRDTIREKAVADALNAMADAIAPATASS
jgi:nicotinamide-nucleotide amidase